MGSSLSRVYTTAKTSPVENFHHRWKNDMAIDMATFFAREFSRSAPVKNFRRMEPYNWLQNGFFINQGLHYGQDFSGGELPSWMEK